jgi:hypothetical protein
MLPWKEAWDIASYGAWPSLRWGWRRRLIVTARFHSDAAAPPSNRYGRVSFLKADARLLRRGLVVGTPNVRLSLMTDWQLGKRARVADVLGAPDMS